MNEFTHLVPADAIGRSGPLTLTADADQRAAVAARLGLESIGALQLTAEISSIAGGAMLEGRVEADVVQFCAATGLPLPARVDEAFALRFVRADLGTPADPDAEIELDDGDCDTLPFQDGGIDVGEAAVQTLALALDPYPRHPDADRILAERGVLREDQAGPFAALAALKTQQR